MSATHNPQTSAVDHLRAKTGLADSKVSVLAGMNLAGLGFVLDKVTSGPLAGRILLSATGLALAVAAVCLFVVLYPRSGSFEFGTAVATDGSNTSTEEDEMKEIVCLKFRYLQYAIKAMILAVLPTLAAIFVGAAS
ncbi:hypothetical protein ACQPZP_15720 [Spirillospora sp. CA-142024]|uniref:hypothetical protein n=1 Tax=Spirillospora sp. CA-142024 TaxID=3240036 RepID=UPI003D922E76